MFRVGWGRGVGKQAGAGLDSALYTTDRVTPRLHKAPVGSMGDTRRGLLAAFL